MARDLHVLVLPWLAFGHMIPFFQLSIALAKAGIKVSYVSTTRNIQRLPKVPPALSSLLKLVEFPLPTLDQGLLPEGAEATVDLPFEKIQYLKLAYDLLCLPIKQNISEHRPDWIIFDFIPCWVNEIASEQQIPLINFSAFTASTCVFFCHPESLVGEGQERLRPNMESLTSPPQWVDFPSSLAFRKFEAAGMFDAFYGGNASGISDAERLAKTLQSSQALAVRSCPEFEGEYLNLLEKILDRPVIPVGLLLPEKPPHGRKSSNTEESWSEIFDWLDGQKPKSVVFVGFGSEYKLSKEEVYEIAYGLEIVGLPFLWALRKPSWAENDIDALPPGFGDRTEGKGVVWLGWAPQMEILAHPSIGGSLFHSGWGSIIETLQFGHCLVLLPFVVDQGLNARVLVEKGLAVEVERREDGSFSREDVAKALRLAMVSEEGAKIRVQARKAASIFGDWELQDEYFGRFAEYLRKGVNDDVDHT